MKSKIAYNYAVKTAYCNIIKQAKVLISSIDEEPLRRVLERQDDPKSNGEYIIHEMLNPILYLRLECTKDLIFTIHYGYEQTERFTRFYPITSTYIRIVYKLTSKEFTKHNIENCIFTDWVVTNCAELFEYIEERNKYHAYQTIALLNT